METVSSKQPKIAYPSPLYKFPKYTIELDAISQYNYLIHIKSLSKMNSMKDEENPINPDQLTNIGTVAFDVEGDSEEDEIEVLFIPEFDM